MSEKFLGYSRSWKGFESSDSSICRVDGVVGRFRDGTLEAQKAS